jgi:hypothetical protein
MLPAQALKVGRVQLRAALGDRNAVIDVRGRLIAARCLAVGLETDLLIAGDLFQGPDW